MRPFLLPLLMVSALLMPMVRVARGENDRKITADEVRQAIDRGVNFLKSQQDKQRGTWNDHPAYQGGATPLCTLALLTAGCGPEDEAVSKALTHLRTFKPTTTYTCALQTMVFCLASPKRDALLINRNARWLEMQQIKKGPRAGMWTYPRQNAGPGDNSNTQFALLGLYEAERSGVTISDNTWRLTLDHWRGSQNPDGSWGYIPGMPGIGSMTCAGIASVIIASGQLSAGDATVHGDRVQCCGQQENDPQIENGVAWLARNFSVWRNPDSNNWLFYYLYGVERTGRMTAQRFIGKHDWYREGAQMLVQEQLLTGSWPEVNGTEGDPNIATSFALMFLAKGRRPIIMGHLKHGPGDDWNHHRGALFNLVSYVERTWSRDLTYQIIDPEFATVEDLLEAPVLYISGSEVPILTPQEKDRLRMYVDRGGFIFAEQSCGGGDFDAGFRQLMKRLFPEPESQLRPLPMSHPAWYAEEKVNPEYVKQLWGIDVGCRTSVIYCPQDLACYWELARVGRERHYSEPVREQIEAARAIGINVLAYATNREVKFKDPGFKSPEPERTHDSLQRGKLYVANILHPGGCNAAPAALGNLLRLAGDKLEIRVGDDKTPEIRFSDDALFKYHMVFLHGRSGFRLTPAERTQLRTYLERGGMIFADAICSSKEFGESLKRELREIFPQGPALERIPLQHPLFTSQFGGEDIDRIRRRQPELGRAVDDPLKSAVREVEPYLEGLMIGDRYALIFSPYDISCALESHESLECEGYVKEDAARLGINILLYSLHQ